MNQSPSAPVPPKISVLIRTTGRPSLVKATQSVGLQRCEGIQLLIANAGTRSLPPLHMDEFGLNVKVIETGGVLDRGSAAQLLLDAASAPYAIFLDDDDWWLEGHLAKLVQALDADSNLVAAYSDVSCVAAVGTASEHAEHVFQQDFDIASLQLANYLPIHSVLFRMRHVRAVPISAFDPALKLFEDWDFWLQLSKKGPFARVPGISAVYALNIREGSGHSDTAGSQRAQMLELLGQKQLVRWHGKDVVQLMTRQSTQVNRLNHLSQLNVLNSTRADELGRAVGVLNQRAKDLVQVVGLHERRVVDLELINDLLSDDFSTVQQELENCSTQRDVAKESSANYRQRADELASVVEHADIQVAELRASLASTTQNLQALHHYSRLQQAEINKLSELRVHHLAVIREIYQSSSWQITRPFRLASRLVASLRQRSSWALMQSVAKATRVAVRHHGIKGFVRRVPYFLKRHRTYLDLLRSSIGVRRAGDFVATTPELRNLRLHPDLAGGGAPIDAKVSVVIPTLNAGVEFALMLRKLRSQKSIRDIEIVIVDSGSKDTTVRIALDFGATVVEILPAEFTHSHARNLGADHSTGDYVLFMVQDAYPIGSYWMYGMLRFLLDHADQKLAAVSCSEYSRSDSDMMYDSMINTHYRFRGCLDYDRIGEFSGDDHMALRSRGQLSDVSCLISRECFQQYRYRGNYAEDLDLGIRLIKSGMKVGMLASVKVIHSHNRPAYYYLKRSFVDVIFLVGLFNDFTFPPCQSLNGLIAGIVSTAGHISRWLNNLYDEAPTLSLGEQLHHWIISARTDFLDVTRDTSCNLGDTRLDAFINTMPNRFLQTAVPDLAGPHDQDEARRFGDTFLARLDHFRLFASEIYVDQDDIVKKELAEVVRKTFAAAAGSALAFYCLGQSSQSGDDANPSKRIHDELAAGV